MTKRVFLVNKSRGKKRRISKSTCSTKLYEDDYKDILSTVKAQGSNESEVIREIISEWYRAKRVEALGQVEGDPITRRIYQRMLEEHLDPFLERISKIQTSLDNISSQGLPKQNASVSNLANSADKFAEILRELMVLRELIERNDSILSENDEILVSQLNKIQKGLLATQGTVSECYASSWSILDLIVRYLVEVNMRDQNLSPDEAEGEAAKERQGLRLEGLRQIAELEQILDMPKELRLARLLAFNFLNNKSDENINSESGV